MSTGRPIVEAAVRAAGSDGDRETGARSAPARAAAAAQRSAPDCRSRPARARAGRPARSARTRRPLPPHRPAARALQLHAHAARRDSLSAGRGVARAGQHHRVGLRSARAGSSRSGPAGSSAPLPQPRMRIDQHDLGIARQAQVLQPVIGDHHVAPRRRAPPAPPRTRSRHTYTGHCGAPARSAAPHRPPPPRWQLGVDAQDVVGHAAAAVAPIAARDHRHLQPSSRSRSHQPDHQRGLAGAARP